MVSKVSWTHDQAVEVLRRCREAGSLLNHIVLMSEATLPEEEKRAVRRAFGVVIGELYVEIEMPIHKAYPDLIPSYLDPKRPKDAPDPE